MVNQLHFLYIESLLRIAPRHDKTINAHPQGKWEIAISLFPLMQMQTLKCVSLVNNYCCASIYMKMFNKKGDNLSITKLSMHET